VLIEGRERVRQLRVDEQRPLSEILAAVASEAADRSTRVHFTVEGKEAPLTQLARVELAAVGTEALRNAIVHSRADRIECALVYGRDAFRLGIRDEGCGIPADVSAIGRREGHYGLIGMRERAERIGAKFSVTSRPGSGTEVTVSLAAELAYEAERLMSPLSLARARFRVPA
jgi:signal transduction histidine kinase